MHIRIIICFMFAVLLSAFTPTQFSKNDHRNKLKIGILRHLTIEEAEQLSIDAQAEKLLVAEAKLRGHEIEFINPQQFICSTSNKNNYDVIISRAEIDNFNDPLTDSYLRVLDYFQTLGIPVINSSTATINAQDKFRTLLLAQKAGVQIPLTFIVYTASDIENFLHMNKIHYPFFIKKPYGGCGKGVFLVENPQMLTTLISKNFQSREAILVEERIDLETDEHGNVKDMRIWVVRDAVTNKAKFVGGSYRTASSGNYLTNTSVGGTVSRMEQPYDEKITRMAEKALESIKGDVAGIDIARDKQGNLYLIEVNISFYTGKIFQESMEINIWALVMDLAEARVGKT